MAPLEALFCDCTHPLDDSSYHCPSLMIEVAHDDLEPIVFLSEKMIDRNFDVVKFYKRRSSSG